jgi:hypothetical protein
MHRREPKKSHQKREANGQHFPNSSLSHCHTVLLCHCFIVAMSLWLNVHSLADPRLSACRSTVPLPHFATTSQLPEGLFLCPITSLHHCPTASLSLLAIAVLPNNFTDPPHYCFTATPSHRHTAILPHCFTVPTASMSYRLSPYLPTTFLTHMTVPCTVSLSHRLTATLSHCLSVLPSHRHTSSLRRRMIDRPAPRS